MGKIMEEQIYEARRHRRRLGAAVLLCIFGCVSYSLFLGYRHLHPVTQELVERKVIHPTCHHPEYVAGHQQIERPEEYAPSILGGLLLAYCAVVGIGAFVVDTP